MDQRRKTSLAIVALTDQQAQRFVDYFGSSLERRALLVGLLEELDKDPKIIDQDDRPGLIRALALTAALDVCGKIIALGGEQGTEDADP